MNKFKSGDKVKHKTSDIVMVVIQYKMKTVIETRGPKTPFNTQKPVISKVPTEGVLCEWVDQNGTAQREIFNELSLELLS